MSYNRFKIYMPNHPNAFKSGLIYAHVFVASQKLGRSLKEGEVVHHIDLNKDNNDPSNLMVFKSHRDHAIFHHNDLNMDIIEQLEDGAFKVKDGYVSKLITELKCEYCHKKFVDNKQNHRWNHVYCSKECHDKSQIKVDIPKEQLSELVKEYSLVQIGKMFGLSDNAIKKKCLKFGIDYKQYSHDIRSKINKQNLGN